MKRLLCLLILAFLCFRVYAQSDSIRAQKLLQRINHERMARGISALTNSFPLNAIAQSHASDLARNNMRGHTGSDSSKLVDRLQRIHYSVRAAAENAAYGFLQPLKVLKQMMGSTEHRANILNPYLTEAGVGLAVNDSSNFRYYWVVTFARPSE